MAGRNKVKILADIKKRRPKMNLKKIDQKKITFQKKDILEKLETQRFEDKKTKQHAGINFRTIQI